MYRQPYVLTLKCVDSPLKDLRVTPYVIRHYALLVIITCYVYLLIMNYCLHVQHPVIETLSIHI